MAHLARQSISTPSPSSWLGSARVAAGTPPGCCWCSASCWWMMALQKTTSSGASDGMPAALVSDAFRKQHQKSIKEPMVPRLRPGDQPERVVLL